MGLVVSILDTHHVRVTAISHEGNFETAHRFLHAVPSSEKNSPLV